MLTTSSPTSLMDLQSNSMTRPCLGLATVVAQHLSGQAQKLILGSRSVVSIQLATAVRLETKTTTRDSEALLSTGLSPTRQVLTGRQSMMPTHAQCSENLHRWKTKARRNRVMRARMKAHANQMRKTALMMKTLKPTLMTKTPTSTSTLTLMTKTRKTPIVTQTLRRAMMMRMTTRTGTMTHATHGSKIATTNIDD